MLKKLDDPGAFQKTFLKVSLLHWLGIVSPRGENNDGKKVELEETSNILFVFSQVS